MDINGDKDIVGDQNEIIRYALTNDDDGDGISDAIMPILGQTAELSATLEEKILMITVQQPILAACSQ